MIPGQITDELADAMAAGYDALLRIELAPGELLDLECVRGRMETSEYVPEATRARLAELAAVVQLALCEHGSEAAGWFEWLKPDGSLSYSIPLRDPGAGAP